jgi:hypothetical protein
VVEVYQDAVGKCQRRLKAANSGIIATGGEGYTTQRPVVGYQARKAGQFAPSRRNREFVTLAWDDAAA